MCAHLIDPVSTMPAGFRYAPAQAAGYLYRGRAPQNGRTSMRTSQALIHPSLLHPLTGLPLRPVGVRRDGRVIWPIMGGAPDGDGDGGDGGSGSGDGAGGGAGNQGAGDGAAGAGDKAAADKAAADKAAADKAAAGKVEDLPDWAQKIIKDTRGEAAENRTKATAAETKLTEQLDGIAKALGLKGEDKADPAELAKQLEQQRSAAKQSAIELAVYRTAGKNQGDPDALLDSRGFLAKLTDLDPTAKDFAGKVETAIKDAVTENPKLKATQAAGSSSADHGAGGSGEQGKRTPKSLADAAASHYGA